MVLFLIVSLHLLGAAVVAQPPYADISVLIQRQTQDCNATCAAFTPVKKPCKVPHCGCSNEYLQAQGDCLVCQAQTAQEAAAVQYFLDSEVNQCEKEGAPTSFELQLPPDAQAIVKDFDRQSSRLRHQQIVFLTLHIAGGHVGLVLVLAYAILSSKVRRDPTFLNFCITWIFSSIAYSILLYRGIQGNTVASTLGSVSPNKCLAQAALINGAQVMTACSTMALVIQLWIGLRAAIRGDLSRGSKQRWVTFALLALPYALFFAFAIPSIFVGRTHIIVQDTSLQQILPTNFYCGVIGLMLFLRAMYGVTLGLLIITAGFDVLIIFILYRHWRAFRHAQTKNAVSLSILLRVVIFSIYRVVVAVTYGAVLDRPPQVFLLLQAAGDPLSVLSGIPIWVDMLQAAIPLVGFLVFGVTGDIISSLRFWRKDRVPISTIQATNTSTSSSGARTLVQQ